MLVLTRKTSEKIVINEEITLMVIEIRGDKVRLGIDAPKHVQIDRHEVWARIQNEGDENDKADNFTQVK